MSFLIGVSWSRSRVTYFLGCVLKCNLFCFNSHNLPLTSSLHLCPLQTQCPEHLLWDRGHRAPEVGPGPVSPGSVGYLLLLHLEGCQVHWKSEYWGVDISCTYCVAWMPFGLCFLSRQVGDKTLLLRENPHAWKAVNLVDLKTQASALSWKLLVGQTHCRL